MLCLAFVGALPFLSACKKTYKVEPLAPAFSTEIETFTWTPTPSGTLDSSATVSMTSTPTVSDTATFTNTPTQTPNCAYPDQTLKLPGYLNQTLLMTYTPTPVTTPYPTWLSEGAIRTASDWDAYCAYVSIDPLANPAPVDFSSKMIIFRFRFCKECPLQTSLESLCRYPDRYEVTILTSGEVTNNCTMDYCDTINFVGYVVDQAAVSVAWERDDKVTINGTPEVSLFLTPTPTP
jgi:hypothetical protein